MPPKIRELIRDLESAGFRNKGGKGSHNKGGKGSHRKFRHANGVIVVVSGNEGDDAKPYQIKNVSSAIGTTSNEEK